MVKVVKIGLTVVAFVNGQMLQKLCANTDEVMRVYESIINSGSESEVEKLLKPEKTQLEINYENEIAQKNKELLVTKKIANDVLEKEVGNTKIFEQKGQAIYMKGINLSIPKFLADRIAKAVSGNELNALINFWKLCAMNPDPRARQDLFGFLEGGNFTITPRGYFIAYRNVLLKKASTNTTLDSFVSASYLKVKGWKKAPKNYSVVKSNSIYTLVKKGVTVVGSFEYIGNLNVLYKKTSTNKTDQNIYTDQRTKTFSIKIGELVQMDRKVCDSDPKMDCSYGLHVGNKSFLNKGSFGNVGIAVLVNPSKVVAVPEYNQNKMRVCEYLPIGEVTYTKDGKLEEIETNLFETNYCDYDIKLINEMITKSGFSFEELKKNELIPYEMTHATLRNIKTDLSRINELIKTRVVKV